MQFLDRPGFIPIPFAESGAKNTIPDTTGTAGAASLTVGFPPETMLPISAGGIPPDGLDMNGILYEISGWSRWVGAGAPVTYNSTFSTDIGGYPRFSILANSALNGLYFSLANNNTNDPDGAGTNWANLIARTTTVSATSTLNVRQQGIILVDATGGNITITLPAANTTLGTVITYIFVRVDATANSVTIQRTGANTIEWLTSIPLGAGQRLTLVSDGVLGWYAQSGASQAGSQYFTSSGTFVVPAGVYRVKVTVTAGGGGGAGCASGQGGGGGAAGSTAIKYIDVVPGASVTVTRGAGGTAGGSGGSPAGGSGGTSSFGAYCSATGGTGGDVTAGGGIGGTATGGDTNLRGGDGGDGGGSGNDTYGGNGGASFWGGGGRAGVTVGGGGLDGKAPGSGAGGAYARGAGSSPGGVGAAGQILVEWG